MEYEMMGRRARSGMTKRLAEAAEAAADNFIHSAARGKEEEEECE